MITGDICDRYSWIVSVSLCVGGKTEMGEGDAHLGEHRNVSRQHEKPPILVIIINS